MTLNDIKVKYTNSQSYQSLGQEQKDQFNALVSGYEKLSNEIAINYSNTIAKMEKDAKEKLEKELLWGGILNIATLGGYSIVKGTINGITDAVFGVFNMGINFLNDVKEIGTHDGRFGDGFWDYVKEGSSDFLYAFMNPVISTVDGLARSAVSAYDALNPNFTGEDFNRVMGTIDDFSTDIRTSILNFENEIEGASTEDILSQYFGNNDIERKNKEQKKQLDDRMDQWAKDASQWTATSSQWFKDEFNTIFSQVLAPQGLLLEDIEFGGFQAQMNSTMESIGRMIPTIIARKFGVPVAYTSAYFYASSFQSSFTEAINQGASIQDAYHYAYASAGVESLTEQIGGIDISGFIKSGGFWKLIASAIAEGSEEVLSEFASAGLQSIINDNVAYDPEKGIVGNDDLIERGIMAFIGGAFSGGVFGSYGYYMNTKTTTNAMQQVNKNLQKVLQDSETTQKGQMKLNSQLDNLLNGYNRVSSYDKNIVAEGDTQLEKKKNFLKKKGNEITASLIQFNEKTKQFEFTKLANELRTDLKGYLVGKQYNVAIDKENSLVSKENDGGIRYQDNVVIATKNDLVGMDAKKVAFIEQILENTRNVVFIKGNGVGGMYTAIDGVIYVDINANINSTTAHEIGHKAKNLFGKKFQKIVKLINSDAIQQALKDNKIEILPNDIRQDYIKKYEDIYGKSYEKDANFRKMVDGIINEEKTMFFIEKMLDNNKVISKAFNISPELVETFKGVLGESDYKDANKKIKKIETIFTKLAKKAVDYKNGGLANAVINGNRQTTYVKIGDKRYKVNADLTGFFNRGDFENQLEAGLNETHYIEIDGELVERQYSELSKKELIKFFELFNAYNGDVNNNIDAIVDNILLEYNDMHDYKEIIGTKMSYIWGLTLSNPEIRNAFAEKILPKINEIIKNAKLNRVLAVDGLYKIESAKDFRKLFALNYIIMDSKYASSVSLLPTTTYENEGKNFYITNNGMGGFMLSKNEVEISKKYQNELKNKKINRSFGDNEVASFFNSSEQKTPSNLGDYIYNVLGAKQLVATNSKLMKIYERWGFKLEDQAYEYSPQMMSEWSNSYNNFMVYTMSNNDVELFYANLTKYRLENPEIPMFKLTIGNQEISGEAEIKKDLVALHNLYEDYLEIAFKNGGFAMPSIAITNKNIDHNKFGDVTLVFGKQTVLPKFDFRNKVYRGDAYTSMFPDTIYQMDQDKLNDLYEFMDKDKSFEPKNLEKRINQFDFWGIIPMLENKVNNVLHEKGINVDPIKWLEEKLTDAIKFKGIDLYNQRSAVFNKMPFEKRYAPFTLENVVEYMIQNTNIEQFDQVNYDIVYATLLRPFENTEQIRESSKKILGENEFYKDYEHKKAKGLYNDVSYEIGEYLMNNGSNDVIDMVDGELVLMILGQNYNNGEFDIDVSEYISKKLEKRVKELFEFMLKAPVKNYLEAKPERVISLNEVKAVLYRDGISTNLKATLDQWGIKHQKVSEYGMEYDLDRFAETDADIYFKLNPTHNVQRDLSKGIQNDLEIQNIDNSIKFEYQNYSNNEYDDYVTGRRKFIKNIDLATMKKDPTKKKLALVIEKLNTQYADLIKMNYNNKKRYNHLANNVIQELIYQLVDNFDGNTFKDKNKLINDLNIAVTRTMAHLDNDYKGNETNLNDPNNPDGYQYTRLVNWGFRDLLTKDMNDVLRSNKLTSYFNLLKHVIELDLSDNETITKSFMPGVNNFAYSTSVEQTNELAISNQGEFAHTILNVVNQHKNFLSSQAQMLGEKVLISKNGKKKTYKLQNSLTGDLKLFSKASGTFLDVFAFSNIFGMFMPNSTGVTIGNALYKAQIRQMQVNNTYYDFFEKNGYLKQNSKNIDALEKNTSKIKNLVDSNGNSIDITNSQVIYLRDILLREIVRNRMIELELRQGEQTQHLEDGSIVYINDNTNDKLKNKENSRKAKIVKIIDLFNELDSIIQNDAFMKKYNEKVLEYFGLMYDFINTRHKDIYGLNLTNDSRIIERLDDATKQNLTSGLNNVDIKRLYVPMRLMGSKYRNDTAFNVDAIINRGIFDGMTQGLTENDYSLMIDSINNIIPEYTRHTSNYYGLFRTVGDMNALFTTEIDDNGNTTQLVNKIDSEISPYIVPYYEKLMKDMAGYYASEGTTYATFNRFIGTIRRNFFKASLGLNVKVIATQIASAWQLISMYGGIKGGKTSFSTRVMRNIFMPGSKTKAQYLIENSEVYKDRARTSTYEISEATSSAFKKSKFNEVTEFLMKGITVTDNQINRALFISLIEVGFTNEQALKMVEEGIIRYQSGGVAIGKNELLRTNHELLRVFTKFLGEPMKVISNLTESIKQIQIINRFESNKDAIFNAFDNNVTIQENKLSDLKNQKSQLENDLLNEKDPNKKKVIKKNLAQIDKDIDKQDNVVVETQRHTKNMKQQVQTVIDGKVEARRLLANRFTGFGLSVMWQTMIGIIFSLLRYGTDDKDEEESMAGYLGKRIGMQFYEELIGYLPLVRDLSSFMIDGYDPTEISEMSAIVDMFKAFGDMSNDIGSGDFNWAKHIRKIATTTGAVFGMPTRQIERLFTTPARHLLKSEHYQYRVATGQTVKNKELTNAIKNGDTRLIETIIESKYNQRGLEITTMVENEINRLAKNNVVVVPSGVTDTFTIGGVTFKNDKTLFAKTYENANFVIERLITNNAYKRLDDEHKGKLIKAVFNYYYNLAKQTVSKVKIYTKERTYTLSQAYNYFKDQISYYQTMQKKKEKGR